VFGVAAFRVLIVALVPAVASAAGTRAGKRRVVLSARFADRRDWSRLYPSTTRAAPRANQAEPLVARDSDAGPEELQRGLNAGVLVGYARCSTDKEDLAAQRQTLRGLGVGDDRVYLDHGMTGRNRKRPGLEQALAAVRTGDTLVVPKLDRLARSVPDARAIGDSLTAAGVRLSIGGTVYDPTDPVGKMFFNILATFAEFEVDLLRMRTREGMAIARANGKLKGKRPKLSPHQRAHVLKLVAAGEHTIAELAELFAVSRATIYREIARSRLPQNAR
jgi:DNA invertase Pin-like site-specific DNA recombinase